MWWAVMESAFGGSLMLGIQFCFGVRKLASVTVKVFLHLIYSIKKMFKYDTFM
jgi:hypothetical protein